MQPTGERWRLGHRPALDGVRGIAVLLVIAGHTAQHGLKIDQPWGLNAVGVSVFFALSGFLITALLLDERDQEGHVDLRAFYERRARRLLPALALFLLVIGTLTASFSYRRLASPADFLATLLYVQNWHNLAGGSSTLEGLSHTWSLSIEEQFYLLWPIAFAWAARRGILGRVTMAAIVYSVITRLILWDGGEGWQRIYFGTDTRADNLLLGCLAAVWLSRRPPMRGRPRVGAAVLACVVVLGVLSSPAWLPLVVGFGTSVALVLIAQPGEAWWLGWMPLRWFGSRSYALYLWHVPLLYMFNVTPWWLACTVPLVLSLALSEASWWAVERRFPRRRSDPRGSLVPSL